MTRLLQAENLVVAIVRTQLWHDPLEGVSPASGDMMHMGRSHACARRECWRDCRRS